MPWTDSTLAQTGQPTRQDPHTVARLDVLLQVGRVAQRVSAVFDAVQLSHQPSVLHVLVSHASQPHPVLPATPAHHSNRPAQLTAAGRDMAPQRSEYCSGAGTDPVHGPMQSPPRCIRHSGPHLKGLYAFSPTVVDTTDTLGCYSERSVVLRNESECPLAPGEITGSMSVTSDDPATPHTADLCGESVARSGIRTLVSDVTSGIPVPVDGADSMTVRSKGKNTASPINLQFTDVPISGPASICGNDVSWHLDLEILPAAQSTGRKSQ